MDSILNALAGFLTVLGWIALWRGVLHAGRGPHDTWDNRLATLVIVAAIVWGTLRTLGHL